MNRESARDSIEQLNYSDRQNAAQNTRRHTRPVDPILQRCQFCHTRAPGEFCRIHNHIPRTCVHPLARARLCVIDVDRAAANKLFARIPPSSPPDISPSIFVVDISHADHVARTIKSWCLRAKSLFFFFFFYPPTRSRGFMARR